MHHLTCICFLYVYIVPCLGCVVYECVCVSPSVLTLRGFCVMSSRLVDSMLSFIATYRRLPSSSGSRECRSPATRGSVSSRPFWISSDEEEGRGEKSEMRDLSHWKYPNGWCGFENVCRRVEEEKLC